MCTVVVAFRPGTEVPLLLAAVRDELVERTWERPGEHWPEHPGLLGGRDTHAGGTWLAVAPETSGTAGRGPRVGAVLNGRPPVDTAHSGRPAAGGIAAPSAGLSRGRLPILMAAHGKLDPGAGELRRYEPFHLLGADAETAVLYSWDGREFAEQMLPAGRISVLVNSGLDEAEPRARRHGPTFAAALPQAGARVLREAAAPDEIWGALAAAGGRGGARCSAHGWVRRRRRRPLLAPGPRRPRRRPCVGVDLGDAPRAQPRHGALRVHRRPGRSRSVADGALTVVALRVNPVTMRDVFFRTGRATDQVVRISPRRGQLGEGNAMPP
ncbi:NRDE family protein [Allosalinactinospora lopnorensis]|uniref:NRDE family protein n=1 Tax=Allosalinactinospora lopnorensis TaxID=1352348 RepID=UPI0030842118